MRRAYEERAAGCDRAEPDQAGQGAEDRVVQARLGDELIEQHALDDKACRASWSQRPRSRLVGLVHPRSPPSAPVRCRGALLPALHFEPVVLPVPAARAAVAGLVTSPGDLVLMVFPDGDVGDDDALVQVGTASNAWPNGARARSLPLLPALRLTGVRDRSHDELRATAEAVLGARQLRRRFFYDTRVIAADGAISAVFWTFESLDPALAAPAGRRQWSRRSRRACPQPSRARR